LVGRSPPRPLLAVPNVTAIAAFVFSDIIVLLSNDYRTFADDLLIRCVAYFRNAAVRQVAGDGYKRNKRIQRAAQVMNNTDRNCTRLRHRT